MRRGQTGYRKNIEFLAPNSVIILSMFQQRIQSDSRDANSPEAVEKQLRALTEIVQKFKPEIIGRDQDWEFHLKIGREWMRTVVKLYEGSWYVTLFKAGGFRAVDQFSFSFENTAQANNERFEAPDREVKELLPDITEELESIYGKVTKDPIGYQRELYKRLPPTMRYGVIPSRFVQELIPDWRAFHTELSKD